MYPRFFKCARLTCSPKPQIPYASRSILDDPHHVLFPRTHRKYPPWYWKQRPDGLWVMIAARVGKHDKLVVRNWLKRRFSQAFFAELKHRGYTNIQGNYVGPQNDPSQLPSELLNDVGMQMAERIQDLRGQADITIDYGMVFMTGSEVKEQAAGMIDEIIRVCGTK